MKKILSMLLALSMVLSLLPVAAMAEVADTTIGASGEAPAMLPGKSSPMGGTSYNIWVGGVEVTDSNKGGISGTGITGTVTYDSDTNTLTMNGAAISSAHTSWNGKDQFSIYSQAPTLTLNLVGENSIKGVDAKNSTYGIRCQGQLTIAGGGSLTVTPGRAYIDDYIGNNHSSGILTEGGLTINGVTLNIEGEQYGLYEYGDGDITVNGGTIRATGETAGIKSDNSMIISGGNVTGTATTSEGYGITTDDLTVSGAATVTASGIEGAKAFRFSASTQTTYNVVAGDNEADATVVASPDESTWAKAYVQLTPGNTISGAIIAGGGSPIEGASVQIQKNGVDFGVPTVTAADGTYTTQAVPDGTYAIKVSKVGYVDAVIDKVTVSGSPVTGVNQGLTVLPEARWGEAEVDGAEPTTWQSGTLTEAMIYASTLESGTAYIQLLGDITRTTSVVINRNVTIDLNGKVLENGSYDVIRKTGNSTLTITDSGSGGKVECTSTSPDNHLAIHDQGTGQVIIKGGTISACKMSIANTNAIESGILSIYDGTIFSSASNAIQRYNTVNVHGGTVRSAAGSGLSAITGNIVNIYDGVVENTNGGYAIVGKTVCIAGGTIRNNAERGSAILIGYEGISLTLTGGTIENSYINGTAIGASSSSAIIIPSGTVAIKGGGEAMNKAPDLSGYSNVRVLGCTTSSDGSGAIEIAKDDIDTDAEVEAYKYLEFGPATAPGAPHTITATAGTGGSISPRGSVTVNNGASQGFIITPSSNYSIADVKVNGVSQGRIASYIFNNVTADHTIAATFSYTGGSGSDSPDNDTDDGSTPDNSNPVIVTPPAPNKPNSPTQGEIKVNGKVDSKGNITVNVTNRTVADAFDQALADAKKNGNEQNGITVVLHVNTGSKTGSHVTVNLPKTVQDTIIAKKIVNIVIVVDSPDISIGLDLATVAEINRQANSDVNVTATRRDNSTLTEAAQKAIGSRPVFDLRVNYGSGEQVQNFGAGSVVVSIPYILGADEKAENIQAVYVDGSGKLHWLVDSIYDSALQVLHFATSRFSAYGIGYKQQNTAFTDTAGHWAKGDINYAVNRGLLSGTSATTFTPNVAVTRGLFVTAIGRLASVDVSAYEQSSFSDVQRSADDMPYIEWANANKIIHGIGNGKFAPDQSITREQLAVIIGNYVQAIGFKLPQTRAAITFADSAQTSNYAKGYVRQVQMAGLMNGREGGGFDPQGTTTRAELAAVLRRLEQLLAASDNKQGWARNDLGQWRYYQNGTPVTGIREIDAANYTFDGQGVTTDVPRNLRYTTYTVQKGDSFWLIAPQQGCSVSELERLNNQSRFAPIYPGDVLRVPER